MYSIIYPKTLSRCNDTLDDRNPASPIDKEYTKIPIV